MGVLGPRQAGPVAEAERCVGVAADANWPHQISTIHLNFLARQKHRLVPNAGFTKDFATLQLERMARKNTRARLIRSEIHHCVKLILLN